MIPVSPVIDAPINVFGCASDAAMVVLNDLERKNNGYVCVANTHMCVLARREPDFMRVLLSASYVVADGWPLSALQRRSGFPLAGQVRGEDLMVAICDLCQDRQLSIGLYGGTVEVVEKLRITLNDRFPNLRIAYVYSPPYRTLTPSENESVIKNISSSGISVLFVGLGCPKQERWMADMIDKLPVMQIGVGAAFDFISGSKRSAPKMIKSLGLEWLYRLISEPRRLFGRYVDTIPVFLYHAFLQIVRGRK